MKFDPVPPLMMFATLGLLGIISYWFVSESEAIPKDILDQFYLYMGISVIPFLIWAGITKSDEELEEELKQQKIIQKENDAIVAKYNAMPELKK